MPASEIRSRRYLRQIIADENGLRWQSRQLGEWHAAAWDEVTDFYEEPPHNAFISATQYTVHFRDGRRLTFSAFWNNLPSLSDAIATHSRNAESARLLDGSIAWAVKGLRPADLPTSFTYSKAYVRKVQDGRNLATGCLILLALVSPPLAIFLAMNVPGSLSSLLAAFTLPTVVVLLIPLIIRRLFRRIQEGKQYREALRRTGLGERFEVTTNMLTVWQNGEKYPIPWSEIIGYDEPVFTRLPKEDTVRIRTVTGKEFSFTSMMEGAELFAQMLPLYATSAVAHRRGQNEKEALGGIAARWTGGEEGKGDRVFHQRTRTHRQLLWIGWITVGIILAGIFFTIPSNLSPLWVLVPLLAFNLILSTFRTLRYFRDRITVGKETIGIRRDGTEATLRWKDITFLRLSPLETTLEGKDSVTQETKTIEFNSSEYAYGNELPDLIGEHIERARAEAERAAVAASDVAQPEGGSRVWNQEASPDVEPQKVMRNS